MHPQAVEWASAEVEGIRRGNVVAFSVPGATGEELVVVCETKLEPEEYGRLDEEVRRAIHRELSLSAAAVIFLRPGSLPKTSSGKLQRRKTREEYLRGSLGTAGSRAFGTGGSKRTLAKHVVSSFWSRAKATLR